MTLFLPDAKSPFYMTVWSRNQLSYYRSVWKPTFELSFGLHWCPNFILPFGLGPEFISPSQNFLRKVNTGSFARTLSLLS
jgi:hypothetical protein